MAVETDSASQLERSTKGVPTGRLVEMGVPPIVCLQCGVRGKSRFEIEHLPGCPYAKK